MHLTNNVSDPRRPDKQQRVGANKYDKFKVISSRGNTSVGGNYVTRYKPSSTSDQNSPEDLTPDYMNLLGMIFSMCGLMMRLKWCAWLALYCSCISFANSRVNDDAKQILSTFMLSIFAIVMSYMQNPQPMTPPWAQVGQ